MYGDSAADDSSDMWFDASGRRREAAPPREQQLWVPTFPELLAEHLELSRVDRAIREDVMEALEVLGNIVSQAPERTSPRAAQERGAWVPTFSEWLEEQIDVDTGDPEELRGIMELLVTLRDVAGRSRPGPRVEARPHVREGDFLDRTMRAPAFYEGFDQEGAVQVVPPLSQGGIAHLEDIQGTGVPGPSGSWWWEREPHTMQEAGRAPLMWVPTFAELLAEHLDLDRIDPAIRQDVMEALEVLGYFVSRAPEEPRVGADLPARGEAERLPRIWVPTFLEWLEEHVDIDQVDPQVIQDIMSLLVVLKDVAAPHPTVPAVEVDPYTREEIEFQRVLDLLPTYPEWVAHFLVSDTVHPALKQGIVELIRTRRDPRS